LALDEDSSTFLDNLRNIFSSYRLNNWVLASILVIAILLESGIIYILTQNPSLMGSIPGLRDPLIVQPDPSLGSQVIMEMVLIFFVIFLGSLGLYLMKSAVEKYVDQTERGVLVLVFGIFLFMGSLIFLWLIYNYKFSAEFPDFSI